ncbi:ATP-binding protein [Kitasatospora sp. NPDC007106]|uniref:sensor histidine kinase n=1 Tax=Kitasatospora sp. NPDC007106 TaxID=3156914 RepID=UPI0033ED12E0
MPRRLGLARPRRPRTIRTRIIALVLIPVVALVGLWTFAMVSMTGDLRALVRLKDAYEYFGSPVDTAVGQIQIERRLAAEYLGSGGDPAALAAYTAQERATDEKVRAVRAAAENPDRQDELTAEQRDTLTAMITATDGLAPLRQAVITRALSWDAAVERYTAAVEPSFAVESALTALQAGRLAREAQVVVELVRVREFVSREDALGSGARAAGSFTPAQFRAFAAVVEDRRVFQRTYVAALPADSRAGFETFAVDPRYTALTAAEDGVLDAGADAAGRAVDRNGWRTTMDPVVHRYMELCKDAALNSAARGRAYAGDQLLKAGLAGGAGLLAVVFSVWYSVRTGRRITRRLTRLRVAADRLANRQLPDVVRRLAAGETVDVERAAPRLAFAAGEHDDEIGDLGRALNHARRAAVEAAVEQARLRAGISGVFVNIARRSQALIHRQLKQLDAMERRATDPDELADLFRVDHLATRMRRHAEGLIILSGAAPGRRWRKPVPLVEVVGSAVGAVEEYERVVVPPMPQVFVSGAAVGDLAHLVAELIENATAFSPPHTQVTMRAGEAAHGCVLEIDDRGLGMDEDELAAANRTLAEPQEFDPTRTERLGLFVTGRLARRHGIEVALRRSPYGGTTAVVLLPKAVLAEPPEPAPRPVPVPEAPAGAEPGPVAEAPAAAVLPMRRALPTRTRQASLSPRLQDPPGADAPAGPPAGGPEISAEQMGAVFGAFQRGLDRGRGRGTDARTPHDPEDER